MHTQPTKKPWRVLLAATVAASLVLPTALMQQGAFAQPSPDKKGDDKAGSGGGSDDDKVYSCHKSSGLVSVTFKPEVELKDLIGWAMGFTCKNYIADPRIVTTGKKVTIIAPNKVSAADAYEIFLIALSTMGYTLVPKGPVYRIVDAQQAKGETLPIYKKGVPENTDQIVRYIMHPSYAQAETMRAALDSMRSPAGNVQVVGSLLLITDYASQIRDMMSLAKAIDVPGNSDGIYTINVKFADATQLQTKLNEILGLSGGGAAGGGGGQQPPGGKPRAPGAPGAPAAGGGGGEESAVPSKILVDDRTNTLIVVSSEAGFLRVKSLVERLDISLDTEGGSSIHVYSLDNALADEIAQTLNNVMGQAGARGGAGGPGGGTTPGTNRGPVQPPVPGNDNFGASLEGQVRIVGDKPSNSLIVMSSGRDFIAIKKVIKDLDQPRRQVFIEALILEVQLSSETDIGTSSHGGYPIGGSGSLVLGGVQSSNLRSLDLTTLISATGLIGGLVGSPLANSQTILGKSIPSYGLLFQALANQANTNILSAPHIIAINNEKTEFSVGNNIPYKKGLSFGGLGTGAAAGIPGSIGANIDRQKLNLVLNITPHISSDDVVRLDVEHETADIGDKDPELGPTWTERKLKTQVVVHDQQSVVIGGLIQERDIYNTTKVPLLGDIPILGYLFKYTQRTKKKTNLLILLTPYIIKDQLDLQAIRERKSREYQEFTRSFANLDTSKFEARVDYKRKRGMVEEINRAVQSVEDDMAYQAQFGRRQQVKEGPIEYGPSTIDAPEDTTPSLHPTPMAPNKGK